MSCFYDYNWGCLADPKRNLLHITASCGARKLLEWALSQNMVDISEKDFESSWTPLHRALYYGYFDCAVSLLKHGANLYTLDKEGYDPLEILSLDIQEIVAENVKRKLVFDTYMWGVNSNYNLGQGDAKSRDRPELLVELSKKRISIEEVAISKFHTVLLSSDGHIYTCGHGRGGRLGHGNEDTILYPKRIKELEGVICKALAAAHDHTLILDQMGQVYSFGLNDFHQLGVVPYQKQHLVPVKISHKFLKTKPMIGIAAGRFHSAMYTRKELYTFGLNAGHLGHPKGDEFQTVPRMVTSIISEKGAIQLVAASDGATICALESGDVILFRNYLCRRIHTRSTNIKRLTCSGGSLNPKFLTNLDLKDPEKLQIAILTEAGFVYFWHSVDAIFRQVYLGQNCQERKTVVDIALGKHLMVVTDDGLLYRCTMKPRAKARLEFAADCITQSPKGGSESSFSLKELVNEYLRIRAEQQDFILARVPLLYHAERIFSDPKSRNFCAIQNDTTSRINYYPKITASCFEDDLLRLLEEADLEDTVHDVVIKGRNCTIAAHMFILRGRLEDESFLAKHLKVDREGKNVLDLTAFGEPEIKRWLRSLYKGNLKTESLKEETFDESLFQNDSGDELDEFLTSYMERVVLRDLEDPIEQDSAMASCGDSVDMEPYSAKKKESAYSKLMKNKDRQRKEVKELAKRSESLPKGQKPTSSFSRWRNMSETSDIVIQSEDGSTFKCHKCILVARSDYFRSMLGVDWIGGVCMEGMLTMPVPGQILKVILDYLYNDHVNHLKSCNDIPYMGEIIVYSDQFLLSRLTKMCEFALAKQIYIKNALEMLEFACTCNAEELKQFCGEYICLNVCYYLESRSLECLSLECLEELTKIYKKILPQMDYRILAPLRLSIEEEECRLLEWKQFQSQKQASVGRRACKNEQEMRPVKFDKSKVASSSKKKTKKSKRKESSSSCDEVPCATQPGTEAEEKTAVVTVDEGVILDASRILADTQKEGQQSLPLETTDNSSMHPTKWVQQSPQAHTSVRSIMEEEKMLQESPNVRNGGSPKMESLSPSKWGSTKKKSQKQRKRDVAESKQLQSGKQSCDSENMQHKKPSTSICPWASTVGGAKSTSSFKEVMNEELEALSVSNTTAHTPRQNGVDKSKKDTRVVPSNGSAKSRGTDNRASNKPWSPARQSCSPRGQNIDFTAIMELQKDEKEELRRISKKPLALIQIEEKAIEELRIFYRVYEVTSEYITVTRETSSVASPVWEVQKSFSN